MKITKRELKQIIKEEIEYVAEQRSSFLDRLTDKIYDFTKTDFFDTTDSGPGMTTRQQYEKETEDALDTGIKAAGAAILLALSIPGSRAISSARAASTAATAAKRAKAAGNISVASSQAAAANVAAKKTADIVRKELAAAGVKKPGFFRGLLGLGAKGYIGGKALETAYDYGKSQSLLQKAKKQLTDKNSLTYMAATLASMGISSPEKVLKKNMQIDRLPTVSTRGSIPDTKKIKVKVAKKQMSPSVDPDALPAEKFTDTIN